MPAHLPTPFSDAVLGHPLLRAYFPLHDTGPSARDASPQGATLTVNSNPRRRVPGPFGPDDAAMRFNGTTDYLTGTVDMGASTAAATFLIWLRWGVHQIAVQRTVMAFRSTVTPNSMFLIPDSPNAGRSRVGYTTTITTYDTAEWTPLDGRRWRMWTAVCNSGAASTTDQSIPYIDGMVQPYTKANVNPLDGISDFGGTGTLAIARTVEGVDYAIGDIAHAALFRGVLTAAEIKQLYCLGVESMAVPAAARRLGRR